MGDLQCACNCLGCQILRGESVDGQKIHERISAMWAYEADLRAQLTAAMQECERLKAQVVAMGEWSASDIDDPAPTEVHSRSNEWLRNCVRNGAVFSNLERGFAEHMIDLRTRLHELQRLARELVECMPICDEAYCDRPSLHFDSMCDEHTRVPQTGRRYAAPLRALIAALDGGEEKKA